VAPVAVQHLTHFFHQIQGCLEPQVRLCQLRCKTQQLVRPPAGHRKIDEVSLWPRADDAALLDAVHGGVLIPIRSLRCAWVSMAGLTESTWLCYNDPQNR